MKRSDYLLFAFVMAIAFNYSCLGQKKDVKAIVKDYNESLKKWTAFKALTNNSYQYTVVSHISYNYCSETKLTIIKGKITGRNYVYYQYDALNDKSKKVVLKMA